MSNLQNLKAGDKVVMGNRWGDRVTTVKRITPTGLIVVHGNNNTEYTFKKNGYERGGGEWDALSIAEWTPEYDARIAAEEERIRLSRRIGNQKWNDLNNDQLRRIVAILDEPR
jgi:hypothetical protein